jgi:hypothetical protein
VGEKNMSEILQDGFMATLPDAEDTALDETKDDEKKKKRARDLNAKGVHSLIQVGAPGRIWPKK